VRNRRAALRAESPPRIKLPLQSGEPRFDQHGGTYDIFKVLIYAFAGRLEMTDSVQGSYTRDQLRQAYSDAWRKQLSGAPLTPLEAMIADVIGLHPEYQAVVRDTDAALGSQANAAGAEENPFLHLGLHMAVREQVSIDRPPGVRELHRSLQARYGGVHAAEHVLMEALGETLWEAQHSGRAPDEAQYLKRASARLAAGSSR